MQWVLGKVRVALVWVPDADVVSLPLVLNLVVEGLLLWCRRKGVPEENKSFICDGSDSPRRFRKCMSTYFHNYGRPVTCDAILLKQWLP